MVRGVLSGVKLPGRYGDHSLSSRAELRMTGAKPLLSPIRVHCMDAENFTSCIVYIYIYIDVYRMCRE